MSPFQICLQNLDPGSSRFVNLDKPDLVLKEWTFLMCIQPRIYIYQQKTIEEPPFEISHQSLDPESSKSVNLDKPDQDNFDSRNLPLVNWPQLGRFLSDFRTFWFKWSPNESHTSCMILTGVTQPPINKLAIIQPFLALFLDISVQMKL